MTDLSTKPPPVPNTPEAHFAQREALRRFAEGFIPETQELPPSVRARIRRCKELKAGHVVDAEE